MSRSQVGAPITLAELKALGEFVRWQDLGPRVDALVADGRLPNGYPLVASRVPTSGMIDLLDYHGSGPGIVDRRWRQVTFVGTTGSPMGGNHRIVYRESGKEKSIAHSRYAVAPLGLFTEWNGSRPASLEGARLLETFELIQQGHVVHSQQVIGEDWPYITIRARSYDPNARWVDLQDMWDGDYTVHVADPRLSVSGVVSREPWFNTTIAVSHRWAQPDHPDPERLQYRELITLAESLRLHDNQAFLIDYCSLPQEPRTPEDAAWFRDNLPGFQSQFKYPTIVLNTGSAAYSTRAWCMLELMLSALSRTKSPLILNHDQLEPPVREAKDLARSYVQTSVWNQQAMVAAFGGGVTRATYNAWTRNAANVALYNAAIGGRREIREKFERELHVTDPSDRAIVLELLDQLVFEQSGE